MEDRDTEIDWLVLVYQFPQGPGARRVKVWRRLQSLGAVAIKNSVYVLPANDQTREDFAWLLQELQADGAEGAILEASFVDGMRNEDIVEMFRAARNEDFESLRVEAQEVLGALPATSESIDGELRVAARKSFRKLNKQFRDISAIDYFESPGHAAAERLLRELDQCTLESRGDMKNNVSASSRAAVAEFENRVWVTRKGVKVDRIASAWLIREWIDPGARFKFVAPSGYVPEDGELRFDMFEAEFTHQGDRCTFEVLTEIADADDNALQCIGEIVHDIDLKDGKFGRAETDGVASMLSGIVATTADDEERIVRGGELFANLYRFFSSQSKDAS